MPRPIIFALITVFAMTASAADPTPLSDQDAHDWLLNVIPLPQQAQIHSRVTAALDDISIMFAAQPTPLVTDELMSVLARISESIGQRVPDVGPGGAYRILVGILDQQDRVAGVIVGGADALREAANADQGYIISQADDRTIVLAALTNTGLYYGVKTLTKLIVPTLRQEDGAWVVDLPLCEIVDWPDLAERGEWGGSINRDLEWLADYKMNLCESHCRGLTVTDEGKGVADFDKALIARGAACATKVVPIITHLDQLEKTGLFQAFPETLGVGDPSKWPYGGTTVKPACFSKPATARVLADWMVSLAEQPEITDINVWLSEHHVACACEECKQKGQFTLEAEAIARGYELAKQARPDIRVRVLLTQGSYASNDQVIAALPKDIGITYYDGGRTYDSSRNEMIYPLLEEYAASGGWLGCYPQLTASWRIVCPWSGPQFIRFRMNEFVEDGLQCLCGYATPDNRFYEFNVLASAEWSWNAKGRDEREFALAYFTQKGLADPQKAADWAVMLGPVGWDVYGARVPFSWFFGRMANSVRDGSLPPLGEGPFVYMPDEEHISGNLKTCAEALALAEELGAPALIAETQAIEGYVKMLQAIHEIGDALGDKRDLTGEEKQQMQRLMGNLDAATYQTTEALEAWQQEVAPDNRASRFVDTISATEATCSAIGEFLMTLDVEDPGRPYRPKVAGKWVTEDFAESANVTKSWDVTDMICGPGSYAVEFVYESGWYGLNISRVSLAALPANADEPREVVAADEHAGVAAYRNRDNTYSLQLGDDAPALRYLLIADIRGMPEDHPEDKHGCNGKVMLRKVRPE